MQVVACLFHICLNPSSASLFMLAAIPFSIWVYFNEYYLNPLNKFLVFIRFATKITIAENKADSCFISVHFGTKTCITRSIACIFTKLKYVIIIDQVEYAHECFTTVEHTHTPITEVHFKTFKYNMYQFRFGWSHSVWFVSNFSFSVFHQ